MPRDGNKVFRRLQQAALDLYGAQGYDQTTAAEIAAKAGVTERTFFRHFADKRDVLFGGENALKDLLTVAVAGAPAELGPMEVLLDAFRSAEHLFVENRPFSEPRHRLIEGNAALQERALAKTRSLVAGLTEALARRGVPDDVAALAAQIGMATLGHAVACWFRDDGSHDLSTWLARAFDDVRNLSSAGSESGRRETKRP